MALPPLAGCSAETPTPAAPNAAAPARRAETARRSSLSSEQVRRVMNAKAVDLSGCYELSEAKEGDARPNLTVEFEVGVDGRVSDERIADGDGGGVFGDCVLRVVRDARFPRAGAPTDVSWPLRFRGRGE